MARVCGVCGHAKRGEIERELMERRPAGEVGKRYGLSEDAVQRHRQKHMEREGKPEAAPPQSHEELVAQARELQGKTLEVLAAADSAGELHASLRAIREARQNLQVLSKLLAQIDQTPQVNVLMLPQWWRVRSCIMEVLEPYPQIRFALAERLMALGDSREAVPSRTGSA